MDIRFEDYLSEDEQKEIIKDVFREKVTKDAERILSNTAYSCVFSAVDEIMDGKAKAMISEKAIEIINDLTSFTVFHPKDAWGNPPSEAWNILMQACRENKPLIQERLKEVISNLDEDQFRETIKEEALFLLDEKLFGKKAA